jgi:phosphoribosylglycinamide formyltransferase-1
VRTGDSEATLHERIKAVERDLLVRTVHRLATRGHTITDRKVTIP